MLKQGALCSTKSCPQSYSFLVYCQDIKKCLYSLPLFPNCTLETVDFHNHTPRTVEDIMTAVPTLLLSYSFHIISIHVYAAHCTLLFSKVIYKNDA